MTKRPANLPVSMTPNVSWRRVDPADVLSGLKTLSSLHQERRSIAYRGDDDVDTLLGWSVSELDLVEKAFTDEDRRRHAIQAVGHAKRAMDCLFDAYLERDFLEVHLPKRPAFAAKLALLKNRMGQQLPWRLIPAVVADPRNAAEHERRAPTIEKTGIAVEAARVIVAAMIAASDPLRGPALVGGLSGGMMGGRWGRHVYVTGFPKHFAWLWRCADGIPRAGIGTASAGDTAEVIFADFSSFTEEQHLEALRILDSRAGGSSVINESTLREKIQLAGLDQPA